MYTAIFIYKDVQQNDMSNMGNFLITLEMEMQSMYVNVSSY